MRGRGTAVAGDGCISVTHNFSKVGRRDAVSPSFSVDGSMPESLSFGDTWPGAGGIFDPIRRYFTNACTHAPLAGSVRQSIIIEGPRPSETGAFGNIGCRSKTPNMKYNMELNPSRVLPSYKSHSYITFVIHAFSKVC